MTVIWCMVPGIWSVTDRIFCPFGLFFALLPPKNSKSQNFEKMKKTPGDITILHECTKHQDHMLYCSWDMVHGGCNCYFSFWIFFFTFNPLTAPKIKISKKWKKSWRCHDFTLVYQKLLSYGMLFLRYDAWQMLLLFFILGYFLPFYPPNLPKKWKFQTKKMKKIPCWYHHFTQVYQKLGSYAILLLRYGMWLM